VIRAVLFDLDDTLYPQAEWLAGAWRAVAAAAPDTVDRDALLAALVDIAAEGSDRGRIVDRALDRVGHPQADVAPMVNAFRSHAPARLEPYPGAVEALTALGRLVPLGVVTDGDVDVQQAKLDALGITGLFAAVVISDRFGREHRKPAPRPFLAALHEMQVPAAHAVFIGDRPDKDVVGAVAVGMRAVRVLTGEYATVTSGPTPWRVVPGVREAVDALLRDPDLAQPASPSLGEIR
jgi:putative hydrolase of the HAD superfamily